MPPATASLIFAIGIAGLIFLERERDSHTSPALWIPVIWMSIGASRMVSQWFETNNVVSADQYLEGSPMDRWLIAALLVGALAVLAWRGKQTAALLRANWPIVLFFLYCVASVTWSDYPAVAFKRWTKALGNLSIVLVVLTDPKPDLAAKRLLAWSGFLLIPASILLIKYYPEMSRFYDKWTGEVSYGGVTEGKNLLGSNCLVFGLGFIWCFIDAFRHTENRLKHLIAYGTALGMVGWLLWRVNSSTSLACILLGTAMIAMVTVVGNGRPKFVHFVLGSAAATAVFGLVFFNAYTFVVEALGRDTSLTGRTELWADVLDMTGHPLFGAGFESFFLGDRLALLWKKYWWHPNEAHNGYLEIYLNLGWIGLSLLAFMFVAGYRHVTNAIREKSNLASLKLALLVVALIYNLTEAAFKVMHPMWICFLLVAMAVPTVPLPSVSEAKVPEPKVPVGQFRMRKAFPQTRTVRP